MSTVTVEFKSGNIVLLTEAFIAGNGIAGHVSGDAPGTVRRFPDSNIANVTEWPAGRA